MRVSSLASGLPCRHQSMMQSLPSYSLLLANHCQGDKIIIILLFDVYLRDTSLLISLGHPVVLKVLSLKANSGVQNPIGRLERWFGP